MHSISSFSTWSLVSLLGTGVTASQLHALNSIPRELLFPRQDLSVVPTVREGTGSCEDLSGPGAYQCPGIATCVQPSRGDTCCDQPYACPGGVYCLNRKNVQGQWLCCPDDVDPVKCAIEQNAAPAETTTSAAATEETLTIATAPAEPPAATPEPDTEETLTIATAPAEPPAATPEPDTETITTTPDAEPTPEPEPETTATAIAPAPEEEQQEEEEQTITTITGKLTISTTQIATITLATSTPQPPFPIPSPVLPVVPSGVAPSGTGAPGGANRAGGATPSGVVPFTGAATRASLSGMNGVWGAVAGVFGVGAVMVFL